MASVSTRWSTKKYPTSTGATPYRGRGHSLPLRVASVSAPGLLHLWESQDCSLYTNELVYSPPSAPHASPWPGLVGMTSASMTLVVGPPVPTSEVAFRALRALLEVSVGTAAHWGDTE